jgi:hypothetical protein
MSPFTEDDRSWVEQVRRDQAAREARRREALRAVDRELAARAEAELRARQERTRRFMAPDDED